MRTRSVLALVAATALVAGCDPASPADPGAPSDAPAPSSSATGAAADPAATQSLGQAAAALGNTSFKVTMTSGPGFRLTGQMDAPGGKGSAEMKATGTNTEITVQTRLVGQDLYVQVPGVTKAGTWTRIDMSRLPEGANLGLKPGQIDPANTAQLLSSTTDVRQTDPRKFEGNLDLTKAVGLTGVDQATVQKYGTNAQKVPFTAGLDEQGRLSALTIQLPAVNGQQAQPLEVLYTDYGVSVPDLKPAANEVVEAPADLYSTLGGK
ncbi:hypothetical protein [Actinoplanes sp. NPDC049265]|uniref:hypothetical protein n=1 Tax=Actinoplanes sp. NPDC049265 TaxID=3363902 RepID=UPI00371C7450